MKHSLGRRIGLAALLFAQGVSLAGCVFLADIGRTADSHIVDDKGIGFNVSMAADGKKLRVTLDTEQAVEKRLVWAATFGLNEGAPATEFEAVASKWLNFEHPTCKAGPGHRLSLTEYEYDLSCSR